MVTPSDPETAASAFWAFPFGGGLWLRCWWCVAVVSTWFLNAFLSESFTESTRNRAELRLVLYSGNIQSELQRNSVVPLLLARDPELIAALRRAISPPHRSG
jgi:two-component system, NtrC family, C4-dicarboxylate transport sensor histidine kinase DctB